MTWGQRAVSFLAVVMPIFMGVASATAAEPADESAMDARTARLLRALTTQQRSDFLAGVLPSAIVLSNGETLEQLIERMLSGDDLEVAWSTVAGGGASPATGGGLRVASTAGQVDAGASAGGGFSHLSGFWALLREQDLFEDGFESGDLASWSGSAGTVAAPPG